MKRYKSLIRLHSWQVDQRRRLLAELELMAREMRSRLERFDQEVATEKASVQSGTDGARTYPAYAAEMDRRRETLRRSITDLGNQVVQARDEVAEAYRELKKYEIAEQNRLRQLQQRANRREQAVLDDVGINMFRRRGQN